MATPLARQLAEAARAGLPFRDWMEACLYDPVEGYYMRPRAAPRTGADGQSDFATSPTLHPFMAQCIAQEAAGAWEALGRPARFQVAEFGGGLGDLAREAQSHLRTLGVEAPWLHVEISPAHRLAQTDTGTHVERLPDGFVGLVVAHEFLDAMPVHLLQWDGRTWQELWVQGDPPALVARLPSSAAMAAAPAVRAEPGQVVAANAAARAWFRDVAEPMAAGRVLVVDYGAEGRRLWDRDPAWGTVRTFAGHRDAGSPLEAPGAKDITASLDFSQLREWAAAAGLKERACMTQEAFLVEHGALEALNATPRDTVEGASAYLRLRQMLIPHAGGMGDAFRVALYEKGIG